MSDPRDTETKILQFLERFKAVPGAYDKLRGHLEHMMAEKLRQDAFSSFGTLSLTTLVEYMETLNGITRKTAEATQSSTVTITNIGRKLWDAATIAELSDVVHELKYVPPTAESVAERIIAESASDGGKSVVLGPQKPERHIKNTRRNKPNARKVAK